MFQVEVVGSGDWLPDSERWGCWDLDNPDLEVFFLARGNLIILTL